MTRWRVAECYTDTPPGVRCPHVGCPHSLPRGDCVLDFVARNPGGATLEQIGELFGFTRERARQVEQEALAKLFGARRLRKRRYLRAWDETLRAFAAERDDQGQPRKALETEP